MSDYNDFKFFNYWKTSHKLDKIRELLNRLYYDTKMKSQRVDDLNLSIQNLNTRFEYSPLNPFNKPVTPPVPGALIEITDWTPQDMIIERKPVISATIVSSTYDISLALTSMTVDGTPVSFISSFSNNNKKLQIYYQPLSNLSQTAHRIEVISKDVKENSAVKAWWFWIPSASNQAAVVVHCYNPEGKEINIARPIVFSPWYVGEPVARIYDGISFLAFGAHDSATYEKPIIINYGVHTLQVKFNGMTLTQNISISSGETQNLTFTFIRQQFPLENVVRTHNSDVFYLYSTEFDSWLVQGIVNSAITPIHIWITGSSPQVDAWFPRNLAGYYFWGISALIYGGIYGFSSNVDLTDQTWTIQMSNVFYDMQNLSP